MNFVASSVYSACNKGCKIFKFCFKAVCIKCAEKAEALRSLTSQRFPDCPPLPVIAMGHLFAAGGTVGEDDGVRDLRIGSLGQISADIFPPCFDYVALGHLHGPQKVNKEERIRYSGSPLPMGFGEAEQQKSVCLVEFEGKVPSVRTLAVPLFQKLEKISGDLPSIEAHLKELSEIGEAVWLEVLYTGPGIVSDLRERLLEKAGPKLEILRVRTAYRLDAPSCAEDLETSLEDMSIFDVFSRRLDDLERQNGLNEEQRRVLLETYGEAVNELLQADKGEDGCAS
jgi:exonuclease SbcD